MKETVVRKLASFFAAVLLALSLTSLVGTVAAASPDPAIEACNVPGMLMGNQIICVFHGRIFAIASQLQPIYDSLFTVLMAFCAYQIVYILAKKDVGEWVKSFIELAWRLALALLIGFPGKVGVGDVPGGIAYQVYLDVQKLALGVVTPDAIKDSSGFDVLLTALIGVGDNFWDFADGLKKQDGSATGCTDDTTIIFTANQSGDGVPKDSQVNCLLELANKYANNHDADKMNNLKNQWTTMQGVGNYPYNQAVSDLKAFNDAASQPGHISAPGDVYKKVHLARYVTEWKSIDNTISVDALQANIPVDAGISSIGALFSIAVDKIEIFFQAIGLTALVNGIGMVCLFLAILFGITLFGLSYFLMTFTPVIVVPIGILIYQMMWVMAPLDGKVKQLANTYKSVILPFAVGPAIFTFLSFFIAAILKSLPDALGRIDAGMPMIGILIFASLLTVFICLFGYKMLKNVFTFAKDFLDLNMTPLLTMATNINGMVLEMIAMAVKMALVAATGGAAIGALGRGFAGAGRGLAAAGAARTGLAASGNMFQRGLGGLRNLGAGLAGGLGRGQRGSFGDIYEPRAAAAAPLPGLGLESTKNAVARVIPVGGEEAAAAVAATSLMNRPEQRKTKPTVYDEQEHLENERGRLAALEDRESTASIEQKVASREARQTLLKGKQAASAKAVQQYQKEAAEPIASREELLASSGIKGEPNAEELADKEIAAQTAARARSASKATAAAANQKETAAELTMINSELTDPANGLRQKLASRNKLKGNIADRESRVKSMRLTDTNIVRDGVKAALHEMMPTLAALGLGGLVSGAMGGGKRGRAADAGAGLDEGGGGGGSGPGEPGLGGRQSSDAGGSSGGGQAAQRDKKTGQLKYRESPKLVQLKAKRDRLKDLTEERREHEQTMSPFGIVGHSIHKEMAKHGGHKDVATYKKARRASLRKARDGVMGMLAKEVDSYVSASGTGQGGGAAKAAGHLADHRRTHTDAHADRQIEAQESGTHHELESQIQAQETTEKRAHREAVYRDNIKQSQETAGEDGTSGDKIGPKRDAASMRGEQESRHKEYIEQVTPEHLRGELLPKPAEGAVLAPPNANAAELQAVDAHLASINQDIFGDGKRNGLQGIIGRIDREKRGVEQATKGLEKREPFRNSIGGEQKSILDPEWARKQDTMIAKLRDDMQSHKENLEAAQLDYAHKLQQQEHLNKIKEKLKNDERGTTAATVPQGTEVPSVEGVEKNDEST